MKHVILTGGSRGIGAELVLALLSAGYRVSTCSRKRSVFIEEVSKGSFSGNFYYSQLDMEDLAAYEAFVNGCIMWGGPLHGLINNAGIAMSGILATFPNVDSERIIRVNLLGPLAMARLAAGYFLRQRSGGRIINVSSIVGTRGYNGLAAYSSSKAGLDGLTRSLARELGRLQVTVNSIAPGYMKTEMSATLSQDRMAQIVNRTPLQRLGEPKDLVGLLLFLLSDAAAFITGQVILVDGGISS
jgi:3-oxoacyl-[acyl-carrier protein] reductase